MTTLRIALALAVVGVALAACDEASPSPMPTPTATDLRTVAAQACKAIKSLDYDVTQTTVTARRGRISTWEYRVSSGRARYVFKTVAPDGAERLVREGVTMAVSLPCFSQEVVARATAMGVSSPEPHYSFDSYGVLHEYWVDSDRRLARERVSWAVKASERADADQIAITKIYSGYGEPNIVPAPIPPTPTPTPTPAPASAAPSPAPTRAPASAAPSPAPTRAPTHAAAPDAPTGVASGR